MSVRAHCYWFALLLGVLSCTGCRGPYDSAVTGTVRLDGELLQQGTVTFLPKSVGAAVYGQVRDDGTFQIKTGDIGGMASGEYTVTVRCVEEIPDKDPNNPPHFKTLIPLKYKNPSTSGLSFEVVPGKNHFEIELARK